jgi:hypothetical protein
MSLDKVLPVEETTEEVVVDAMPDAEKQFLAEIIKLNVLVGEAAYEHDLAKHHAKVAKEHLDSLQMRLHAFIKDGPKKPDPQKELPFIEWQQVPIEQAITVTEKQLEKLHEGGIKTVIEFETERAGNRFAYIKGIGEKAVEKWEEQILGWMAVNAREPEPSEPNND